MCLTSLVTKVGLQEIVCRGEIALQLQDEETRRGTLSDPLDRTRRVVHRAGRPELDTEVRVSFCNLSVRTCSCAARSAVRPEV